MFSKEDFIAKYRQLDDNALFEIYQNKENYGHEAHEALNSVIAEKGGLDVITMRLQAKQSIANEVKRIENEVFQKYNMNVSLELAKSTTLSSILSDSQKVQIIENKYHELAAEAADKQVQPKTVMGSIIGGLIASITGGLLWALHLFVAKEIFVILYFGLFLFCYGIIYFFTRQSKANKVVMTASLISCFLALAIGYLLLELLPIKNL